MFEGDDKQTVSNTKLKNLEKKKLSLFEYIWGPSYTLFFLTNALLSVERRNHMIAKIIYSN